MSYRKFSPNEDTQLVTPVDLSGQEVGASDNPFSVAMADGTQLDAFSRLRTSSPHIVFDAQHHYGEKHFLFVDTLTLGGTLTDVPATSSLLHTVTATTGSKVRNASRRHYYQAGLSQMAAMTFNFGTAAAASVVLRTSTSGVPVETVVAQADWNIDPMDGTGASGITVDWTKTQILLLDMQWLGVGRVRISLDIDGVIYPVHEFLNANNKTEVYMQSANLPICYITEKTATGINREVGYYDNDDGIFLRQSEVTALGGTFKQLCSSVFSEGASQLLAIRRTASNDTTPVTVANGVLTPVLSIRPSALFLGRANKGTIIPERIELFVSGGNNPIHWEIWEDATLTAPIWTAHSGIAVDTPVEIDTSATAATPATGTRARGEGYVAANGKGGSGGDVAGIDSNYQMQIDPSNIPDVLTIMASGGGGTAPVLASIEFSVRY